MIVAEENTVFKSSDRISYFLSKQKGEKGKVTELLKVLGFKHKSMFYTRMNSNSWTLEEILHLCQWWEISITEFIGTESPRISSKKFLEERVEALELMLEKVLNNKF